MSCSKRSVRHFEIALLWNFSNHDDFATTVLYGLFFTTQFLGFLSLTTTNLGFPSFYPRERPEGYAKCSLLRSRLSRCHAALHDIPKDGCEGDYEKWGSVRTPSFVVSWCEHQQFATFGELGN